jgi:hypothetical protein
MPTPRKSTRTPGAAAESAEVAATFVPVYSKSVERLAEVQKKSLEAAVEQNAEILNNYKKAFPFVAEGPASFWFDLATQSFERYVETQKDAIDLAVEQSATLVGLAEERGTLAAKFADSGTALFQRAVDHSVAAHKKNLEFCAEQQKVGYETAKKQFRFTNPFAEAFQSGLDLLIETQKTVLDIASKPVRHAA